MSHRQNNNLLRLLAGWCGLLLYVGAFSPIGMGVTALLGAIDPDHQALFQPGAGGTRLVLHHEGKCSEHHHHAIARALTVFSQPASATDPDHVLQFSSASSFTRNFQIIVSAANQSEPIAVAFAEPVSFVANRPIHALPPSRPPPGDVEKLLCLRSTVLLI